jgi:hypothetical protein
MSITLYKDQFQYVHILAKIHNFMVVILQRFRPIRAHFEKIHNFMGVDLQRFRPIRAHFGKDT